MTQAHPHVHFIAIGGSAMHNLAIALKKKGFNVTGSDDEIFEPSRSRLAAHGLLPAADGWFPAHITPAIDAVILGMHARVDNPELLKAQELGLKIYSYPEYIYEQSKNKQRIVVAGSHGKTTITSMIMHVLKYHNRKFDYLVGAQLEGFDTMVQLSEEAPIIVIEGDEYLSSPIDREPKFLKYKHHIGVVSGIAWDHINVFPTLDTYVHQFERFADATPRAGILVYNQDDTTAANICKNPRFDVNAIGYGAHKAEVHDGTTYLIVDGQKINVPFFGQHNMQNVNAAKSVCNKVGVTDKMFYEAISSFKGAANRLQLLGKNNNTHVFKDFAHAPSKLKATTQALKKQFPERKLIACLELHTFSSLNKAFLGQYANAFDQADLPIVYFNPDVVKHKKLEPITAEDIKQAFNNQNLLVFTDSQLLLKTIEQTDWENTNLLLMTSGNFNGINFEKLTEHILANQHEPLPKIAH